MAAHFNKLTPAEVALPWPLIQTEWLLADGLDEGSETRMSVEREFLRTCKGPGWNPKTVHLGGSMLAIDYCSHAGPIAKLHSYKVALVEDHPFLAQLNEWPHVPRSVKHIYRKETRLKYLFAKESWDFLADLNRAEAAWEKYGLMYQTHQAAAGCEA